jgi:arabinose-5-phosphate isomerase
LDRHNLEALVAEGARVLAVEAEALQAASRSLSLSFAEAVGAVHDALGSGGKVVTSGVGKSGIVAQKVAATFTSTGSRAVFLHPTEALHGDLGLLAKEDILIVFSHSGSSEELLVLMPLARELCRGVVAIVGRSEGPVARGAQWVIETRVTAEACPDNLVPSASSTLAIGVGDAMALVLKGLAGFGPDHFARFHPGGRLGKLLAPVGEIMHGAGSFGIVSPEASMDEVVISLTRWRQAGICVSQEKTQKGLPLLAGVIVEGDIRRALIKREAFFKLKAKDIMSVNPRTVSPETRAREALELMEQGSGQLGFLPVVDAERGCLGVLRVHDLVLTGLN